MQQTYIIGDIHGEFDTLLALVAKLPKDAKLIFVGDLIDRGPKSAEVVKFVRECGHGCVMGNHEEMMVLYGMSFSKSYPKSTNPGFLHNWYNNGGDATLFSYGLIRYDIKKGMQCVENEAGMAQFLDDIAWMQTLPLYVELPHTTNDRPVVITHASCADVWHHHDNPNGVETFRERALWHRKPPNIEASIFNIYGHTPVEFGVEIEEHYVNVDTGCYANTYGFGELSAYCVETGEVVSINRRLEELKVKENTYTTK
ncbi:serine/threonine protein phosphatase [hydrothermal vent metagenome]|uniref:Serine/threonine protein phosphatase n=1 Tax=hydrothermal vent metagenome TaxID=652676 RepID=A0A1W1C5N0_9ZZZZ